MDSVLETFHAIQDDQPTAIVAYTIKGYGLPMAGHKDNHAGLMSPAQCDQLRQSMKIPVGSEWDPFTGLSVPPEKLEAFMGSVPFARKATRVFRAPRIAVPHEARLPISEQMSTQTAFGRLLNDLASVKSPLVDRIVTASPDVASSTNLGPWITKQGIFDRLGRPNVFAEQKVQSSLPWAMGPQGQHFELGITETNLFLLLGAAGLAAEHHGERLFPIGTLYDPFIRRGLDALNYACYQDARFIIVGTPSGVTLAPEGGAHQSVITPLIGMGHPGLTYFEPAYADELREMLLWSFEHLQDDDGGSVYLRLSTRKIDQLERPMTPQLRADVIAGGYWLVPPTQETTRVLVAMGAALPEAMAAQAELKRRGPPPGLLAVTSPGRLARDWLDTAHGASAAAAQAHIRKLLAPLNPGTELVTVLDGHPLTLAWMGAVTGIPVRPLGVKKFGASGSLADIYRMHEIDVEAIVDAATHS